MIFPEIVKKDNPDWLNFPAKAELKLDGELIGWNGYDFVNERGVVKTGLIKPEYIPTHNCQLWGEMYYNEGKDFYSEQLAHQQSREHKVAWFDVIELDGVTLYGTTPYKERRLVLEMITPHAIKAQAVFTGCEVQAVMEDAVDEGYEGVVIKPLDSYTFKNWVKMKRSKKAKLLVKGVKRAGRKALAIGTEDKIYGSVSYHGWEVLVDMLEDYEIASTDKHFHYFKDSDVKVEVQYQHLIQGHNKLRNPFITRILDSKSEITEGVEL